MKIVNAVIEGVINEHAWVNDTWLSPYAGYSVILKIKNGIKTLLLDGHEYDVTGEFFTPNGWNYKIEKLIS